MEGPGGGRRRAAPAPAPGPVRGAWPRPRPQRPAAPRRATATTTLIRKEPHGWGQDPSSAKICTQVELETAELSASTSESPSRSLGEETARPRRAPRARRGRRTRVYFLVP